MNTTKRKSAVTTNLDPEVDQLLRWLASDFRTSRAGLLRYAVMLLLEQCGEELPAGVAHLRRVPFAGEVPEFAGRINPETITTWFDDPVYAAIKKRAEGRGVTVERWVGDLVKGNLARRFPEDPGLN